MQRRKRRPTKLVAILLTMGLVLSLGTSAVIASTALTSGGSTTYSSSNWSDPADAGFCQYREEYSKTFTGTTWSGNSAATITVTYNCKTKTVCITSTKGISNYTVEGDDKVEVRNESTKICFAVDPDASTVTVKSGTTSYTFQIPAA